MPLAIQKLNLAMFVCLILSQNNTLSIIVKLRIELCEWIFENYEKPKNHQFLVDLSELVYDISQNVLRIDLNRLFRHSKTDRKAYHLYRFINGKEMRVLYDIWGSVTGRLTTNPMSFPMLNLKKEIADCVIPKKDVFVQFDFNGAEIRTFVISGWQRTARRRYS